MYLIQCLADFYSRTLRKGQCRENGINCYSLYTSWWHLTSSWLTRNFIIFPALRSRLSLSELKPRSGLPLLQLILSFKPSLQLVSLTTHKWSSSVTCNSSCHHSVAAVIVLVLEAIVSVVFSIVFSRGNVPCVWDLVTTVIRPRLCPV